MYFSSLPPSSCSSVKTSVKKIGEAVPHSDKIPVLSSQWYQANVSLVAASITMIELKLLLWNVLRVVFVVDEGVK
jgi:hypothetical protein